MDKKKISAKRVGIVSLKLVKEGSVLYETRKISSPYDIYNILEISPDYAFIFSNGTEYVFSIKE